MWEQIALVVSIIIFISSVILFLYFLIVFKNQTNHYKRVIRIYKLGSEQKEIEEYLTKGQTALITEIPDGEYKILSITVTIFILFNEETNRHFSAYAISSIPSYIRSGYILKKEGREIEYIPSEE